jgi:sec-independent protein translocase protein TatB
MFDIGWSELVVIGVVALIAIGPKELPGVLRMVGQWIGKARRMAGEFQGQFQEAMREAEVADLKKQFDEVSEAATSMASGNVLTSTVKDVEDALRLDTSSTGTPTTPEPPTAETQTEATVHEAVTETSPQGVTYQPVDKAS